jgi:hypothetical protein
MERYSKGLDLTEAEFDLVNAEKTAILKSRGVECEAYAGKNCPTNKGYWMQIVEGYEDIFTQEQLDSAVEYVPLTNEETIEL